MAGRVDVRATSPARRRARDASLASATRVSMTLCAHRNARKMDPRDADLTEKHDCASGAQGEQHCDAELRDAAGPHADGWRQQPDTAAPERRPWPHARGR